MKRKEKRKGERNKWMCCKNHGKELDSSRKMQGVLKEVSLSS